MPRVVYPIPPTGAPPRVVLDGTEWPLGRSIPVCFHWQRHFQSYLGSVGFYAVWVHRTLRGEWVLCWRSQATSPDYPPHLRLLTPAEALRIWDEMGEEPPPELLADAGLAPPVAPVT